MAVRRTGLTGAQKRALAIADNRTAELAEWDAEQLQADVAAGLSLQPWFSEDEAAALLAKGLKPVDGLTDPDDVPAERPTDIQLGDLFQLGKHRLLCGDSTCGADVGRLVGDDRPFLMVTDPPYGVSYDPTWRDEAGGEFGDGKTVMRGNVTADDRSDWTPAWELFTGAVAYVWHASLHTAVVVASLQMAKFTIRACIVWRKPSFIMSRGHYHWQHEPCWYAVRDGKTAKWSGDRSQTTIWDIAGMNPAGGNREVKVGHGTQKPVECMARPIKNHGGQGDHVYDPFCGSGSTLIASEQLGRRCFAIEIEPRYVQMAIDRWEAFTGAKAQKVGELVSA